MTDRELNSAAAKSGFKNGDARAAFRRGHADAAAGKPQHGGYDPAVDAKLAAAYDAGYALWAEQQKPELQPGEHAITIEDREVRVVLNRAAGGEGWEVTVPIAGGSSVVYGDTAEIALSAARDRIAAAATEFAERGQVRSYEPYTATIEGTEHLFHVTTYTSGAVDIVAEAWDDVNASAADFDAALDVIVAQVTAKLAQTVDGEPARIIRDPRPTEQQLPRTSAECAAEVHRCIELLREREQVEESARTARKSAESALATAYRALLDATDREAAERAQEPELPLAGAA